MPYPVIAAAPGAGGGPIKLLDALTGDTLQIITPYVTTFTGGVRVAVGDLTITPTRSRRTPP